VSGRTNAVATLDEELHLRGGPAVVVAEAQRSDQRPHDVRSLASRKALGEPAARAAFVVELVNGAAIKPERIRWLWRHWIAAGKLHILAGAPGCGKTTIALALATTVTTGGQWPDDSRATVGNVLVWSGEDDPADTLVPRLMAMGADLNHVYFVKAVRDGNEARPFDPSTDMLDLLGAASQIAGGVSLLVVDPVVSAIAGDSHKNAEVRRGLQPLVDLAAALSSAVIGITHLSKGTVGRDPTERVTGSIAFGAVARMVLLAARTRNNDGEERRVMVRAKTNIAPDDGGFEYRIDQREATPEIEASALTWGVAIAGTARDLLAQAEADSAADEESSARVEAAAFLESELKGGPKAAKAIFKEAREAGHSERTIKRAKKDLRVESRKAENGWVWALPANSAKRPIPGTLGPLGTVGPLEPAVGPGGEERL